MKRLRTTVSAVFVATALLFSAMPVQAAEAIEVGSDLPVNQLPAAEQVYVLDANDAVTRNGQTFYPAPPETQDMHVIMPDVAEDLGINDIGTLNREESRKVEQQLASAVTAEDDALTTMASNASWTSISVWANGHYGPWTKRSRSIQGYPGLRWAPQWATTNNLLTGNMCAQAVGWDYLYSWGGWGHYERQIHMGCVSGRNSVPWGNVSAYPQLRMTNISTWAGLARFQ